MGSDQLKPGLQHTKRQRIIEIGNAVGIGVIGFLVSPGLGGLFFEFGPDLGGEQASGEFVVEGYFEVGAGEDGFLPLFSGRCIGVEVYFVSCLWNEAAGAESVDGDEGGMIGGEVTPGPEEDGDAFGAAAEGVLDFFEVGSARGEVSWLLLMLQSEHGECSGGLADVDAMIVQAHGAADDAAEAHISLRTDEAVHLHRHEAS